MAKMTEFSEFAHNLAAVFRKKKKPEDFVTELFDNIYLYAYEDNNPVDNVEPRTLKGYFYGNSDISTIARDISDALDTTLFAAYLELDADDAKEILCDKFRGKIPDINTNNYQIKIAERFKDIIVRAAEKATKKKKTKKQEIVPVQSDYSLVTSDLKSKYGDALVMEANGVCQHESCSNRLYIREVMTESYEVVTIDPDANRDDPENLTVMCPQCAKKYALSLTKDKVEAMKIQKRNLCEKSELDFEIAHEKIESGIPKVIAKIPELPLPAWEELNYNPVKIKEKIDPAAEKMLYFNVSTKARGYYNMIDDLLKDSQRRGEIDFDTFCLQVNMEFRKLKNKSERLPYIFHALVDWLISATGEERETCETVISYFVQKCEVFDVISKQAVSI